jgi:glycosyltransferase involved in cell wall biosynthesis
MRLVVDLQALPGSTEHTSEIDDYPAMLVGAMLRHASHYEIEIVVNHSSEKVVEELQDKFPDLFGHAAVRVSRLPFLDGAQNTSRWHRAAAELVREHALLQPKPDVVLCAPLSRPTPTMVLSKLRCLAIPTAVATGGLAAETGPPTIAEQGTGGDSAALQRWQPDLVLTASEFCKRLLLDTLELPRDRVVVVPLGVDEQFQPTALSDAQAHAVKTRFAVDRDFILSLNDGPQQSVERLLAAYALLPAELRAVNRLLVVGVTDSNETQQLLRFARLSGLAEGELVVASEASDHELAVLYNRCKLVVLSGSEDTAARQILKAMSCGAPVLGPDHAAIREIVGSGDALFDPLSARHVSQKIYKVLASEGFREKLKLHALGQAQRFSSQETARRSFEALEMLYASRTSKSRRLQLSKRQPRIAYLSPLPPERSGIADYSAELLPELAKHYDIELITDLSEIADPYLRRHFRRVPLREFERSAQGYDRILYHIGNSPFHFRIPALIERFPGLVVLHDFFLSHLFHELEAIDGVSLWRNLYLSHGYPGLIARARQGAMEAVWAYPCNLTVLSSAAGIVVHSEHARQLASDWFGVSTKSWKIIPQLRRMPRGMSRHKARRALGISPETFLVCSFGFWSAAKLSDLLVRSWLGSRLSRLPNCRLLFVGGDWEGKPYQATAPSSSQIRATGYLSREEYELYLAAADVGVQLRSALSRGETPRSVLDCMAHGIATVVSSHPALTDLAEDSVLKVSANCTDGELISAFEKLYREPGYRGELGRRARQYVKARRSPAVIARQYVEAVEESARDHPVTLRNRVVLNCAELAAETSPPKEELATVASCIAENSNVGGTRQLFVDVTILVSVGDFGTGIQRVTRAILAQLLENPPAGYRVEPVFRTWRETYRYARRYAANCLRLQGLNLEDALVSVNPGDVFLGLDWDSSIAIDDQAANWLLHHRQRGMKTVFTVYDLLPLEHPEWFKPGYQPIFEGWLSAVSRLANGFACISRTVADELMGWLDRCPGIASRVFEIGFFHLGGDLEDSWASDGLSPDDQKLVDTLKGREVLLMVGTVEPRKGHSQALSAMERLWAAGEQLSLVICGREGWVVDSIAQDLRSHHELGHRLFWIEQATDEALLRLYSVASGLLMASEGEGFGLPLVEAAQHGLPIITRDLPVFREVAGEHAFYFSGPSATDLADALRSWLTLYRRGEHPRSNMLPRLSWQQSAQQLLRVVFDATSCRRWQCASSPRLGQPVPATTSEHSNGVLTSQSGNRDTDLEVSRAVGLERHCDELP